MARLTPSDPQWAPYGRDACWHCGVVLEPERPVCEECSHGDPPDGCEDDCEDCRLAREKAAEDPPCTECTAIDRCSHPEQRREDCPPVGYVAPFGDVASGETDPLRAPAQAVVDRLREYREASNDGCIPASDARYALESAIGELSAALGKDGG